MCVWKIPTSHCSDLAGGEAGPTGLTNPTALLFARFFPLPTGWSFRWVINSHRFDGRVVGVFGRRRWWLCKRLWRREGIEFGPTCGGLVVLCPFSYKGSYLMIINMRKFKSSKLGLLIRVGTAKICIGQVQDQLLFMQTIPLAKRRC
jgi:hypothetical protein